jgi:hypothetical protein
VCTLDAFAHSFQNDAIVDVESAVVAVLQHVPPTSVADRGPGAEQPDVRSLLAESSDVLAPEIPGGLPPERVGVDGKPIECAIDTHPDATPYARSPRPFTPEETAEIRKYLDTFFV